MAHGDDHLCLSAAASDRESPDWRGAYGQILASALGGDEISADQITDLGERLAAGGAGPADLALEHHRALSLRLADQAEVERAKSLSRAGAVLARALAPMDTLLAQARARAEAEARERVRAEEALWQAQRHQAVGRLAGGVAHHFNNLLTVVLGSLDLDKRDRGGSDKLERATEAARRAVKLTRQLLTFSSRQRQRPAAFLPSQGLADLVALVSGSLSGDIAVESEIPAGLWPVRVDVGDLELALLNLAVNAGDAMGGRGRLSIVAANQRLEDGRLGLRGDYLMIAVSDDGPGFDPIIVARVFDPFFTTKGPGVGAGLGLSQVQGFAHQAKGAVEIDSQPGAGATVRLYLPADHATAPPEPPSIDTAKVILVVEQDMDVAEIAAAMLDSHGFSVRLAYRAQVALDLLRGDDPVDLAFCDLGPSGAGESASLVREIGRLRPGLPVLLTGADPAEAGRQGLDAPMIAKPYRSGDLYTRIMALLGA